MRLRHNTPEARSETTTPIGEINVPGGNTRLAEGGTEFAGGEGVEGAEAGGELGGGQAALAVEAAEKIVGRLFSFLGVAFHATRDQVAVGIAPQARLRHDVVQALRHDEEIQNDPLPNFGKSVRLVHGTRIAHHLATPRTPA